MITAEQAADIRARNEALMAWVDSIRGKNGWASYKPEDKPANVPARQSLASLRVACDAIRPERVQPRWRLI